LIIKRLKNKSLYIFHFIIGLLYPKPKVTYLGFLEGVIFSNSIFHIQLNCKGAYWIKMNGKIYPIKKLYAFKSSNEDIFVEIEIKGVYKNYNDTIRMPVQLVEPKIPSSKLNKTLGIKQSIISISNEKMDFLNKDLKNFEISNKIMYLNKIYRKSNRINKAQLIQKKNIYKELENHLKNENI